jgi:serine/threonine-protein kinase RsbW
MPADKPPLTLTVPSDLRLLGVVRGFVQAVCQYAGFDRATTDAVVLATHEAANNVIRHAHHDTPDAQLQIQCHLGGDRIEVRLLDEGAPFDLASVPHLHPGELRIGGRGVYLMRTLMDELCCEPRGDRGNLLRMVKRIDSVSHAAGCG